MKKNNRGFTLVELLAVIVILGLLMAIAIPSVTKYITQSRVKTLVSTVESYVTSVVTQVNDGEYKFSDSTKVFAIPIECISLEKGGTNPFGNWMQANEAYWAYVLVHYDSENYNYEYGFTFKDDAGYGLYPTINDKIENSMVRTGYDDLLQPQDGLAKNFVSLDKWEGFTSITTTTELVVLEAETDGIKGNSKTTCTLQQKGDNYEEVEEAKIQKIFAKTSYAIYSEDDQSLTFIRSENSINVGEKYNGKIISAVYTNFEKTTYTEESSIPWYSKREEIKSVTVVDTIRPISTAFWFSGFKTCSLFELENLKTIDVTTMEKMFYQAGYSTQTLEIEGLSEWNTSKVKNMAQMFRYAGATNVQTFKIEGLNTWDVSSVTTMYGLFGNTAQNASIWDIGDLSKWNTTSLTNMRSMFTNAATKAKSINIGNLGKWNVSKVTTTMGLFNNFGQEATSWYVGDLSGWNTANIEDMNYMFNYAGPNANWSLNCSKWNVDKVSSYANFNKGVEAKVTSPTWKN